MDKKIVKNYIYSNLYQLLVVAAPFITTPYLTRVMGAEMLSVNSWTANIAQWFVLFGIMGVNIYGNREIAKVRDDKPTLSKTFFEIFSMQLISMVIATICFISYAYFIGNSYQTILLIQGITLLSVALDITWFFYGVEDFKKASIRNMLVKIIGITLIFTLVKGPTDLVTFVLINSITAVVGQFIMWAQLKQYISYEKISFKGVLRHVKPNIGLFIPQIAISVYSVLDITMLGAMYEDIRQVNFYEQTQKFVKMFLFFVTSIGSVMLPRIANTHQKKDFDKIDSYLQKTMKLAIYMSIPMIFGISAVIQNFIGWFLPPEYSVVSMMIIVTSPIMLFISLSNVFGTQYMVPTGMSRQYTISVVLGAITNFAINLCLIPQFGAYGAIVGSVTAELVVTLVQYLFVKDKLKLDVKISSIIRVVIASSAMALVCFVTGFIGSNILINLLQVVLGLITYVIMLLIMKDTFLLEMIKSLRRSTKNV